MNLLKWCFHIAALVEVLLHICSLLFIIYKATLIIKFYYNNIIYEIYEIYEIR